MLLACSRTRSRDRAAGDPGMLAPAEIALLTFRPPAPRRLRRNRISYSASLARARGQPFSLRSSVVGS